MEIPAALFGGAIHLERSGRGGRHGDRRSTHGWLLEQGPALQCQGQVDVLGSLTVSGAKQFRIDHPLNPETQYLSHAAVEAPEMKNLYDGIVTIGRNGRAVVELPRWFGALNRTFRYQLTPVGAPCPTLFIAAEIRGNRFTIGGGRAGLRVSWQVTGIRNDLWARTHPMDVEAPKPKDMRGATCVAR
jgi:hypothetical protein